MSTVGTKYYTTVGGQWLSVNEPAHNPPLRRPITGIRALSIGAAYQDSFEVLAHPQWIAKAVMSECFRTLPMYEGKWAWAKTEIVDLGLSGEARRWLVKRK